MRWWWSFAALIGIPALVLAVLGIRTVDLQRAERRSAVAEQQAQIALLADTTITAALTRIEQRLAQPSDDEAPNFSLDAAGRLEFPRDQVFFGDPGVASPDARTLTPELLSSAEEALAAEAQGDTTRASAIYHRLAGQGDLSAWARLSLARIQGAWPEWIRAWRSADENASTPDGTPVMLLAAGFATRLSPGEQRDAFLRSTLNRLRSGRWWLSYSQRKLYDTEIGSALQGAGEDDRLTELDQIERAIRGALPFRRDSTRVFVQDASILLLLNSSADRWQGAALTRKRLERLLTAELGPIRKTTSFAMRLADASGKVLWGDTAANGATRRFPVRAVMGWEIIAGEPVFQGDVRDAWLGYGFVALLLLLLGLGVAMTGRTVKREMELARLQAEFAAGVTHEFKSPITGIRLLVERILSGRVFTAASIREYGAAIRQETDHLDHLVNRLLETHRIQSGEKRYQIAPHCVTDIAQSAMARLRTQADAKRIEVRLDSDQPTREIDLDRTAMQDSIENLLDNAIKYSPPDTRIGITIRHEAAELAIRVRDQGIGIDPADVPKIFDRFYRGRRGHAQSVSGTGLGLSLVKATAEGHGGSVEVRSVAEGGTEFEIRIPIHQEESYVANLDRG